MQNPMPDIGRLTVMDGAFGTMLPKYGMKPGTLPESMNLSNPEAVTAIHKLYVDAGAEIIVTNTFGASRAKLAAGGRDLSEVITAAVACAKKAAEGTSIRVALDIGPLGELLEPGGTLSFEEAYARFAEIAVIGARAGADLILIETLADLYEAKAALLAARENTNLPVFISMTFEPTGRSFTGVPVEAMAAVLSPLGPSAIGINCSMGPAGILPLARRLCESTDLPVFIKPNAGLPDPATGLHDLTPELFLKEVLPAAEIGVCMIGGCCGTTPAHIALLKEAFWGKPPAARSRKPECVICSDTTVLSVTGVHPIGERINPTGKKRLQEALRTGDLSYIQAQAAAQQRDGAAILDVNVGAPGVDEAAMLPLVVKAVQAVSNLPLQLDSANPAALEAALRVVNGKAIVNSTSGEREKLDAILPLCKKYGAAVVGLTLDENGIPETAEGRYEIAKKIFGAAQGIGIPAEDVFIDCLTLAASALPGSADVTLGAMRMVRERLGAKLILGVSNISFGLPNRALVNRTFLTMAMEAGLNLPILNPGDDGMMGAVAAYRLLKGQDTDARDFVARYGGEAAAPPAAPQSGVTLSGAVESGLRDEAAKAAAALLETADGMEIINAHLMPSLDRVGAGFEKGTIFLPRLLAAAGAAQAAFEVIRGAMAKAGAAQDGPPVVIATVKGDVHDIGKNIVRVLLENYGFSVIDLGRDVPPERVVEAARRSGARLVGLSALMTTTLPAMADTISALKAALPGCRVMVGGAVLTAEYSTKIGADFYGKDANRSVVYARELHGMI